MPLTPVQTPNPNADTERWVSTIRAECLDWLLIIGRGHLEQMLQVSVEHCNRHRPHQAHRLGPPDPIADLTIDSQGPSGSVHRRDRLSGHLHEDRRAA